LKLKRCLVNAAPQSSIELALVLWQVRKKIEGRFERKGLKVQALHEEARTPRLIFLKLNFTIRTFRTKGTNANYLELRNAQNGVK